MLKFFDLFVSDSSSVSILNAFKRIDMNTFSKLKGNNICFVIATLCSMSTILMFFWDIGFQDNFFGYRQSLAKYSSLL